MYSDLEKLDNMTLKAIRNLTNGRTVFTKMHCPLCGWEGDEDATVCQNCTNEELVEYIYEVKRKC